MVDAEAPVLIACLTELAVLYKQPLSESILNFYWNILKKYSFQQVQEGIEKHLASRRYSGFMPKPGDILRQIEGDETEIQEAIEFRSALAWSLVLQALSSNAAHIEFEDKIIHVVLQKMGGLNRIGRCNEKDFLYVQQRFEKLYRAYCKQQISLDVPKQLSGGSPYAKGELFVKNPDEYPSIDLHIPAISQLNCNESGYRPISFQQENSRVLES